MNKSAAISIIVFLIFAAGAAQASANKVRITLNSPADFQVFQRISPMSGEVKFAGHADAAGQRLQFRVTGESTLGKLSKEWTGMTAEPQTGNFKCSLRVPAGGWYRLEVLADGSTEADVVVEHVGVGEVFIVAGQSNSTNYGSERQTPQSGQVSAFDGKTWRLAADPKPGVDGNGGSFIPSFGDALYERYKVPIGVASTGAGATSVRQWLMKGEKVAVHPTVDDHIKTVAPGQWECTGELYDRLVARMNALGQHGVRAVLWHQGESDAGQARSGFPADRQITGDQYAELLTHVIRSTQKDAGWEVPWFVAQATYHSEKDPADAEFRAAQKSLWESRVAHQGPDTDALRLEFRAGVHMNAKGLREHGRLWAEKVSLYLDEEISRENK